MKKSIILLSLLAVFLFGVCGDSSAAYEDEEKRVIAQDSSIEKEMEAEIIDSSEETVSGYVSVINENRIAGVGIGFEYIRMSGKASNQLA